MPSSSRFQQQAPMANFVFPREAKHPQHGQQPDKDCKKIREPRSFQPRPGH